MIAATPIQVSADTAQRAVLVGGAPHPALQAVGLPGRAAAGPGGVPPGASGTLA